MTCLIVALFATLAVASAVPSGLGLGLGGLDGLGGWGGLGLGLGAPGALLIPPSAGAVITRPALGLGLGLGPIGPIAPAIAPIAIAAPAIAPAAAVAVTNGGGTIGVSGHGAIVSGPKTAPVVIEGPAGVVKADGLWGPTLAGVLTPAGKGW